MKYDAESIKKRKSISNKVKKIVFIFMIILLYNLTLIYISYMNKYDAPTFFNFKAFVISTGSMRPELDIDDVVIVEACDEKDLHVGNIITYWSDDEIITHRIVNISNDKVKKYYTKGDNNNVGDKQYVTYSDIEGKMVFKIPGLGKLFNNIKEGVVVILVLLVILVLYLNNIGSKELSKKRRKIKKYEDDKYKAAKKMREANKLEGIDGSIKEKSIIEKKEEVLAK